MSIAVSVCVAVYNVEKYLEECLQSLINQTLRNAEFIIIDDGSTDTSLQIIKTFLSKDNRFKLFINNENQGLLLTRKKAIEIAQGNYIIFLDGDDYLSSKDSLLIAYNEIVKNNVDILRFKCCCTGQNQKRAKNTENSVNNNIKEETISNTKALLDIFKYRKFNFCIWNKIYNKNSLKNAVLEVPQKHFTCAEDAFYTFIFLLNSKTFKSVNTPPIYTYRVGVGISSSEIDQKKIVQYSKEIQCTEWLMKIINQKQKQNQNINEITECLLSLRKTLVKNQVYRMTNLQSKNLNYFIRLILSEIYGKELFESIKNTLTIEQTKELIPISITNTPNHDSKITFFDTTNSTYLDSLFHKTNNINFIHNPIDILNNEIVNPIKSHICIIQTRKITNKLLLNVLLLLLSDNTIVCIDESKNDCLSLLLNAISHITISSNKNLLDTLKLVNNNTYDTKDLETTSIKELIQNQRSITNAQSNKHQFYKTLNQSNYLLDENKKTIRKII